MISTESLTTEWIDAVSKELKYPDKGLLEKAIRALSLLELLVKAGCPPGTYINQYLAKLQDYGFTRAIPTGTEHPGGNVPVSHSKVFYEIAYNPMQDDEEGYIRLDVLYEDIPYSHTEMVPIEHPALKTVGEPVMVQVPTKEDILGDKLTAFGPNSIGIPYEKRGRNCSLEIVKQLYDIGRLFDNVQNFTPAYESFKRVSTVELGYRNLEGQIHKYYEDVRQTAMCISTRGFAGEGVFPEIIHGLSRIKSFMFQQAYLIEFAITDAAKAAYLATSFQHGNTAIEKYTGPDSITADLSIDSPLPIRLPDTVRAAIRSIIFFIIVLFSVLPRK
ncbi:MAG: nucleotidyl transferase AbiEii/AbiGii toxin family protein [Bacteroidales bacterium]|nr:nucleotidyl transferase AbiEii/AbiGii toxin family protein [Bacteroidales bacterium]